MSARRSHGLFGRVVIPSARLEASSRPAVTPNHESSSESEDSEDSTSSESVTNSSSTASSSDSGQSLSQDEFEARSDLNQRPEVKNRRPPSRKSRGSRKSVSKRPSSKSVPKKKAKKAAKNPPGPTILRVADLKPDKSSKTKCPDTAAKPSSGSTRIAFNGEAVICKFERGQAMPCFRGKLVHSKAVFEDPAKLPEGMGHMGKGQPGKSILKK